MQTDLFMTKKEILLKKLKEKKLFSSHYIREVGINMRYDSADRRVREMVRRGEHFKALTDREKIFRGLVKKGNANLAWYEVI